MTDLSDLMDKAEAEQDEMIVKSGDEMIDALVSWLRSLQKYEPDLHEPQDGKRPIPEMRPERKGRYIYMPTALRSLPDLIEKLQED